MENRAAPAYAVIMSAARDLYDRDFYAWTLDQAAKLRAWPAGIRPNDIDLDAIAEEIETLGRSDRCAVQSLLRQLLIHLTKLRLEDGVEARRGRIAEVREFRAQLETILDDSPSLAARIAELAAGEWLRACRALAETYAAAGVMPPTALPFDVAGEVLHPDWLLPASD
jgi:Domain of unknown function DUF29